MKDVIQAHGSIYACGKQIGAACNPQLRAYLDMCASTPPQGATWEQTVALAQPYLAATRYYLPETFSHIQGLSEGSGISLPDIWTCCVEELWQTTQASALSRACTDIVVCPPATNGQLLVGHTNDLGPELEDLVTYTKSYLDNGLIVLSIGIAGLYTSVSINSARIALTGNELTPNDNRVGIPRALIAQATAFSTSFAKGVALATHPHRASSYNNVISSSHETVSVEASATHHQLIYPTDGILVHANKFTCEDMLRFEGRPNYPSSDQRLSRAAHLASQTQRPIRESDLITMLRDHGPSHTGADTTICRHGPAKTVFSVLLNMTQGTTKIAHGNPCEATFDDYTL